MNILTRTVILRSRSVVNVTTWKKHEAPQSSPCLAYSSCCKKPKKPKPIVIVDVDAGSDDAIALLLLIAAHKRRDIKLKAITCVAGNTTVNNVTKNVMRLLEATSCEDIPVYKGAAKSIIPNEATNPEEKNWHGKDGFGDVKMGKEPNLCRLKKEHAVSALYRMVSELPDKITLITLGPLTNVGLCVRMYPKFLKKCKNIFVMGGNYMGVGNISDAAEFNFGTDPEAAHIVLEEATKPMVILPWETCKNSQLTPEWRMKTMGAIDTPQMKLMNAVEKSIMDAHPGTAYEACDPSCVAVMLNPKVIKDCIDIHVSVELNGKLTRGQMVLDHTNALQNSKKPNVRIVTKMNVDIFKNMLMWAAGHKGCF